MKPIEIKIQLYALTKTVKQNKCLRKFVRVYMIYITVLTTKAFHSSSKTYSLCESDSLINTRITFFGELNIFFEADRIPTEWIYVIKRITTFQCSRSHRHSIKNSLDASSRQERLFSLFRYDYVIQIHSPFCVQHLSLNLLEFGMHTKRCIFLS